MNTLKKLLGTLWIALAFATAYYCINIFGPKLSSGKQEDLIFGIIIFFILLPLVFLGLAIFGWFAIKNEYDE